MPASSSSSIRTSYDPWSHRVAWVLCCATFPLIWIGGLVTTYDAGMAVPDWPTTYGYNLFLYPWQTWLFGPFDLLVEHGHRLLASAVGLLAIALVVVTACRDTRSWVKWVAGGALAIVIAQGLLGGARVQLDERTLALLHGVLGLGTFGYLAATAVVTSRFWATHRRLPRSAATTQFQRSAYLTAGLIYFQIVLGAFLRHTPVAAPTQFFRVAVLFHIAVAFAVVLHAAWLVAKCLTRFRGEGKLLVPSVMLLGLVSGQVGLGFGTWVLKYGWPAWFGEQYFAASYTVAANSWLQGVMTTAHVALGALIFATSIVLVLRAARFFEPAAVTAGSSALLAGLAT